MLIDVPRGQAGTRRRAVSAAASLTARIAWLASAPAMKRPPFDNLIRPGGILRWSTACLLAGALGSCERESGYVATERDAELAADQLFLEKMEAQAPWLKNGKLTNNFHLPPLGYYHVEARRFFEHPYGHQQDGRYFINGSWSPVMLQPELGSSRPLPEVLEEMETLLEEMPAEEVAGGPAGGSTVYHHHHGSGLGNALMMYWLLSGNRGAFSPGAGFQRGQSEAGKWQQTVNQRRDEIRTHAAANPAYQRLVAESRARGQAVRPGQSVRTGFGTSSQRSFFSGGA